MDFSISKNLLNFLHSPTIHSLKTVLNLLSFETFNDSMYSTNMVFFTHALVWINRWTFSPHSPSHKLTGVSVRYRKRHGGGCGSLAVYVILFLQESGNLDAVLKLEEKCKIKLASWFCH